MTEPWNNPNDLYSNLKKDDWWRFLVYVRYEKQT